MGAEGATGVGAEGATGVGAEGAPDGSISIEFTFHEDAKNISKGRGCGSKGTDREEERADGVSRLVVRL